MARVTLASLRAENEALRTQLATLQFGSGRVSSRGALRTENEALRAQLATLQLLLDTERAQHAAKPARPAYTPRPIEPAREAYRAMCKRAQETANRNGKSVAVPSYAEFEREFVADAA